MPALASLPPAVLSRIAAFAGTPLKPDPRNCSRRPEKERSHQVKDGPTHSGLRYQSSKIAASPRPDVTSLQNLRLVSKFFDGLCTPLLFQCVKVLPRAESVNRYTQILKSKKLNSHVRKVIFQTRHQPHMSKHGRSCYRTKSGQSIDQESAECYSRCNHGNSDFSSRYRIQEEFRSRDEEAHTFESENHLGRLLA